jgi:hypothetical protein
MKCKYCGCSLTRDRAGVLHDTEIPFLTSVCHRSPVDGPTREHAVATVYKLGDVVDNFPGSRPFYVPVVKFCNIARHAKNIS